MIVHKIAPHEEPSYGSHRHYPVGEPLYPRRGSETVRTFYGIQTKIGYAQYIEGLKMKVGDFIVLRNTSWPFQDSDFFKIEEIQEVHYLAKWNRENKFPMCLSLINQHGMKFWGCPENYFVVEAKPVADDWGQKPPAQA